MSKPRMTKKQKIIMGIILTKAGEGKFLSIKELHELLPYACTYGAARISVRFLIKHDMLARNKTGTLSILVPTSYAYEVF